MDAISYSYADKQAKRIKKFINDPDSTSGVLTVPKTIAAGETITIPAGRVAILPDLQVDGDLVVDGDLFIPTGSMTSQVVQKVTSTDNAIVRFDGTTGQVQNSSVVIDDSGNLNLGSASNFGGLLSINVAQTSSYAKHLTLRDSSSGALLDFSTYGDPSYGTSNIVNYTGSYLAIRQNNTGRMMIDSSGNVLVTGGGGLGYGTGAGGTVTQLTSKSTTVTLNKPSGQIIMNNAALAAGASVMFQVSCSVCSHYDVPIATGAWTVVTPENYRIEATKISYPGGTFFIKVTNVSGTSLSEALTINFAIIKGANS
jgi:hypothetical protein